MIRRFQLVAVSHSLHIHSLITSAQKAYRNAAHFNAFFIPGVMHFDSYNTQDCAFSSHREQHSASDDREPTRPVPLSLCLLGKD